MALSLRTAVRLFVAVTLAAGGVALFVGSVLLAALPGAESEAVLAAVWSAALAVVVLVGVRGGWPASVASGAVLGSMLGAIAWSRFDPSGHLVLSGLAPSVAVLTGIGVGLRHPWSWSVALASVVGFGPLVLLLAPLPDPVVAVAFVLFAADAVALLAIQDEFAPRARAP